MFKNTAGQKVQLFAYDATTGAPKTGDGANITPYIEKDGAGSMTALTDSSATELSSTNAPGMYEFDVSQSECNADILLFTGKSSTSDVYIVPRIVYTRPTNAFRGIADTGTMQSGSTSTTAVLRAALSLANDIPNGGQLSIIGGTGAGQTRGVLDFVGSTDTVTVDAPWTTTPDNTSEYIWWFGSPAPTVAPTVTIPASEIRSAVGLASADLDTQLGALPTNAELATALASADDAVLAAIAALNNLSQANVRTALGMSSANLDTQLGDIPTNSELTAALAAADDAVLALVALVKANTDKFANLPVLTAGGTGGQGYGAP